jgi:hypothetical protein
MALLKFILLFSFLNTSSSFANESEIVNKNDVEEKLFLLKLEKIQAEAILKNLGDSGRMNKPEINKVKREIASIQEEGIKEIKESSSKALLLKDTFATK